MSQFVPNSKILPFRDNICPLRSRFSLSYSLSVPTLFFPPFLPFSILTHHFFSSLSLFFHRHSLIHSLLFRTLCHSDSHPPSHAPFLSLSLSLPSSSLSLFPSFPFPFSSFLFLKRYRYPPLCLNCRSRDSRPRRARLRGLPPAILPTQQQQSRFTSLIPRHLSSLETNLRDNGNRRRSCAENSRTDARTRKCDRPLDRLSSLPSSFPFIRFPNSRRTQVRTHILSCLLLSEKSASPSRTHRRIPRITQVNPDSRGRTSANPEAAPEYVDHNTGNRATRCGGVSSSFDDSELD